MSGIVVVNLHSRPLFRLLEAGALYDVASSFRDYITFSLVHIYLYSLQPLETVWSLRLSVCLYTCMLGPEHLGVPGLSLGIQLMLR